jgi:hypothetical protein
LESLPGGFVGHFGGGQRAEFVVTQRQEPFGGFGFTRLHTIQEERDVAPLFFREAAEEVSRKPAKVPLHGLVETE